MALCKEDYPLRRVREFGDNFYLVSNSQDIRAELSSNGIEANPSEYGCLFVEKADNGQVWGCLSSVPTLGDLCEFVGRKVE